MGNVADLYDKAKTFNNEQLRAIIRSGEYKGQTASLSKNMLQTNLIILEKKIIMFGLGIIKGTIIGMSVGILTGLALKELCKMKKKKDKISEIEKDIPNTQRRENREN